MGQDRQQQHTGSDEEIRGIKGLITVFKSLLQVKRWPSQIWKLKRYKRKKVRSEMSLTEKQYLIQFKMRISDPHNPQQLGDTVYQMVVPARAAYFAKRKLKSAIKLKIQADVIDVDCLTDDELKSFRESKEAFLDTKKDEI